MKIAYITDVIYPFTIGGSEIRFHEVAKRLVKKGHEVHIYGAKWWDGKDNIYYDGVSIHGLIKFNSIYSKKTGKRNKLDHFLLSLKIFIELLYEDYDLIDVQHFAFFSLYLSKIVSKLRKTPLVITWHQYFGNYLLDYFGNIRGKIVLLMEKNALNLSEHNIAVSNKVKEDLIEEGSDSKNIAVIPNGVDFKKIAGIKNSAKLYDLIFVGRLTYQKNIEFLINSLSILKKEYPHIKLCLIGDGDRKEKLIDLAKKLEVINNIEFKGNIINQRKVFEYMKKSKIFVLPSRFEGFPIVAIEANACSLPIVTPNYKLNRTTSFITNNGLISENNPLDFASKISFLLKNEKKRKELGNKGYKLSKNFNWEKIANKTEQYYLKISRN